MTSMTKRYFLLIFALFGLLWTGSVHAQMEPELVDLTIKLWPEFDRPETLVIYQGELTDSVPLPVTLTFHIPAEVEGMHAVAVADAQGTLVNNPYTLEAAGEEQQLTFTLESPGFHFEYYDPQIVAKTGIDRSLSYQVALPYAVNNLEIEVKQPLEAKAMQFTPPADQSATGADQFVYHYFRKSALAPNMPVLVAGTYQKASNIPTTDLKIDIPQPTGQPGAATESISASLMTGYVLVGLGAAILLGIGGWWWFNNRAEGAKTISRQRETKKRVVKKSRSAHPPKPRSAAKPTSKAAAKNNFCSKCGVPFKEEARFCHQCGAERK